MPVHRPKLFHYVVTGSRGHFPLDMLRYAESYPSTTDDANIIETLIRGDDRSRLPRTVAIRLGTPHEPDGYLFISPTERWASFGWKVITDERAAGDAISEFHSGLEAIRAQRAEADAVGA